MSQPVAKKEPAKQEEHADPAAIEAEVGGESSKKQQPKGTANVERRTWDKDEYRKKAEARLAAAESGEKEEFYAVAPAGLKGPEGSKRAFLQARKRKVDVDSNLNKTQTISSAARGAAAGGYYCKVCDCTLRDSVTWLDHINGKKHQRRLGFSMRVERSSVGDVAARLAMHKKASDEPKKARLDLSSYDENMRTKHEAEVAARRAQLEERRARKKKEEEEAAAATSGGVLGGPDEAMMAMMGFGGFGGSKKKR